MMTTKTTAGLSRPAPLKPGARVALLSPSSPSTSEAVETAQDIVREMGFEPVVYPSTSIVVPERGYLAAESDEMKISDINGAFADDSIDGIFCTRGGSGAGRVIDGLDERAIAAHPKVFAGYSDITIIHSFLQNRCGMITFHSPMPGIDDKKSQLADPDGQNRASMLRALTDPAPIGRVGSRLTTIIPGTARGPIVGGNLSLLTASIGTLADFDTRGKILFIESVGTPPFRVDRFLSHLKSAGRLRDAAGIVLGEFVRCEPGEGQTDRSTETVLREIIEPLGIPAVSGLPVGHGTVNLTLPLGATAYLDAANGELIIEESALEA